MSFFLYIATDPRLAVLTEEQVKKFHSFPNRADSEGHSVEVKHERSCGEPDFVTFTGSNQKPFITFY